MDGGITENLMRNSREEGAEKESLESKLGMANGLETVCGQAYGARQYHMLGIYLQRSCLVCLIASTLILPLFIFTTPILKAIGQQQELAHIAGTMALWLISVLYSFILSYTCQMYLQSQSKNMIIAYLAAISLTIHVFLSWLLTMKFKFGISGAMISTVIAFWISNIGQVIFVTCGGCPQTWRGFSVLAFKDLWPILKLSLSGGAMICFRIANELGGGNSKAAKLSITTILITSFSIGFVLFVLFLLFQGRVAYLFTESKDVVSWVDRMSSLLAVSILLNCVQPVLSGVAIGSGWQSTVAFVNVASYYFLGVPIGIVLGYIFNLQVEGVWIGMLIVVLVQTIILVIITCRTDWEQHVSIAQTRVNRWYVKDESSDQLVSSRF